MAIGTLEKRLMAKVLLKPGNDKEPIAVEFQRNGARFNANINGHTLEGVLEDAPGSEKLLRLGHRVIHCHVLRKENQLDVWLKGETYRFEIVGGTARKVGAAAGPIAREVTAPMPGTILRIHVQPGDVFTAHQPLIIMESMKMEMTLSAPHAGRVDKIHCGPGELVPMGKVLLELDLGETHAQISA